MPCVCHFMGISLPNAAITRVCCWHTSLCSPPMAEEYVSLASQSLQVKLKYEENRLKIKGPFWQLLFAFAQTGAEYGF